MSACFLQLLGQTDVVLQVVLAALGIEQVTGVAQRAFAQGTGFQHRVHGDTHVVDPVERVKDAEHINTVLGRLLHEVAHHVVGIVGVTDRVGGAQQHLEKDVGCGLAQTCQALPGIFFQETQGHVKGGTAPTLHTEQAGKHTRVVRRDLFHVVAAHARGKQRLVGVAHGGVGQQHLRLVLHPLGKAFGSQLLELVAAAFGNRRGQIAAGFDWDGQRQRR